MYKHKAYPSHPSSLPACLSEVNNHNPVVNCHSNGFDGPDKFTFFYFKQKDMRFKERKVILEMNVQITSLSETEPKEKENRKQSIKRWGGGTHTQLHKTNSINVTEIGLQQN